MGTLGSLLAMLNERLVVAAEPIDWGHDRTLLRENLRFTPEQRIERIAAALRDLSRRLGIELPITEGVCAVLGSEPLHELVGNLMRRVPTTE